jgi:large conductance mechanosensitive channel
VPINHLMEKYKKPVVPEITTKACPQCLSDVPLAATRCKFCTQLV